MSTDQPRAGVSTSEKVVSDESLAWLDGTLDSETYFHRAWARARKAAAITVRRRLRRG